MLAVVLPTFTTTGCAPFRLDEPLNHWVRYDFTPQPPANSTTYRPGASPPIKYVPLASVTPTVGVWPPVFGKASTHTLALSEPDARTEPEIAPSAASVASTGPVVFPAATPTGVARPRVALPSNHCETNPPGESTQSELNSIRYFPGASPPTEYRPLKVLKFEFTIPAPLTGVAVTQAP